MTKNNYDKSPNFLCCMHLHEIFDKKSYKMDIYKFAERVYNKNPE